jgi:hypothetical protein
MNALVASGTWVAALDSRLPFASPGRILPGERSRNLHEVSGDRAGWGPPQANKVAQGDWRRCALQA